MSSVFQRWQAYVYFSNTDVSDTNYNTAGEVLKSVLDTATIPYKTLNINQVGYTFTPTNELANDIGGRPYNRNRGFVDSWNLQLTPYYFDQTVNNYYTVQEVTSDMSDITKYRHLWLYFVNLDELQTMVVNTKAVKVVFDTWSESINTASGTRTATISFRRKYRID